MSIESSIITTSQKKNHYIFDKNQKRLTICHPILYQLIKMNQDGQDIDSWIQQNNSATVVLDEIGSVSADELHYYYKKFIFLKDNGYFGSIDVEKKKSARLQAEDIETVLANVNQIVFEVTDRCNLKCEYCAYGKFYDNFEARKNMNINLKLAKRIIDFFIEKIKSPQNNSFKPELFISFYGGEPLLNFPLIKEIVDYISHRDDLSGINIKYNMTTNGTLLEKYMDFIVKHRIKVMISLDGDEKNNSYRVFANGKPAFPEILHNVKALQSRYPEFFSSHVSFNAVLHDRNSLAEVYNFFNRKFSKYPIISGLSFHGLRKEAKAEFLKMYKNVIKELKSCAEAEILEEQLIDQLPYLKELFYFIRQHNFVIYYNLNYVLNEENESDDYPTGSCLPFSKKVFITVDGRLFPCERIGQTYRLGRIISEKVELRSNDIAQLYNKWFDSIKQQCLSCYQADCCPVCIYYINSFPNLKNCQWHLGYDELSKNISKHIDLLEDKPELFVKLIDELI